MKAEIQSQAIDSYWDTFHLQFADLDSDQYEKLKGAFYCGAAALLDLLLSEGVIANSGFPLVTEIISELEYANPNRMN